MSGVPVVEETSGTSEMISRDGDAAGMTGTLATAAGSSAGRPDVLGVLREGMVGMLEWLE
jgi:hypothetical protein